VPSRNQSVGKIIQLSPCLLFSNTSKINEEFFLVNVPKLASEDTGSCRNAKSVKAFNISEAIFLPETTNMFDSFR